MSSVQQDPREQASLRDDAPVRGRATDLVRASPTRLVLTFLFWVVVGLVIWNFANVLLIAFAGLMLAVLLDRVAKHLFGSMGLPRRVSVIAAVGLFLGVVGTIGWFVGTTIVEETNDLAERAPQIVEQLLAPLEQYSGVQQALRDFVTVSNGDTAQQIAQRIVDVLGMAFASLVDLLMVLAVGLFLVFEPRSYRRAGVRLVPVRYQEDVRLVIEDSSDALGQWLVAKAATMLLIGILTTVGLLLLGMPYPYTLGLVAGLLAFVPYLGPILGFLPAAAVSLSEGTWMLLWVSVLYGAIQLIESYGITPIVQRSILSIPPALLIVVQVCAGIAFGIPGLFVATPLLLVAIIAVRRLYLDRRRDGVAVV